jgi:hypothetical protein
MPIGSGVLRVDVGATERKMKATRTTYGVADPQLSKTNVCLSMHPRTGTRMVSTSWLLWTELCEHRQREEEDGYLQGLGGRGRGSEGLIVWGHLWG